jgi:hypothetical protein
MEELDGRGVISPTSAHADRASGIYHLSDLSAEPVAFIFICGASGIYLRSQWHLSAER